MMRNLQRLAACFALLTWGVIAHAAPPSDTPPGDTLAAMQAATIEATGPRTGDNADKYFNVQGKSNGKYACYGLLRFDGGTLKKKLDKQYGAGKYKIANVTLLLTQSRAKFSKDGKVEFYFRADTMPDMNVQSLKFPYNAADKAIGGSKIVAATPSRITSSAFQNDDPIEEYYKLTNEASGNSLKDALLAGKIVTLVVTPGEDSVAETYAGLKGIKHRRAPTLMVSLKQ